MKPTETLEISEIAFATLAAPHYPISISADGQDALCAECAVIPLNDSPKQLLLALANHTTAAKLLHVGDKCSISVPPESATRNAPIEGNSATSRASNGTLYDLAHTHALICGTIHASIPCGRHTVYLADVTEAIIIE